MSAQTPRHLYQLQETVQFSMRLPLVETELYLDMAGVQEHGTLVKHGIAQIHQTL